MADASELGIHPPATVRIDMGGWIQDWPWHCVEIEGDQVSICWTGVELVHDTPFGRFREPDQTIFLRYPYEHARSLEDGTWIFHGREDFTVSAGPPQPPSLQ